MGVSVTLAELRLRSRQRSNMVGSTFVGDTELDSLINGHLQSLYDKLVTAYGDDYFCQSVDFSTVAGTDSYDLVALGASKFLKIRGVDFVAASDYVRQIKKFNFEDRNKWVGSSAWSRTNWKELRYRLIGQNLVFRPTPNGIYTVRLWYVPAFTKLVDVTNLFDGINGWEQIAILKTAKAMLEKEESDTTTVATEIALEEARLDSLIENRDMTEEPPRDVYNYEDSDELRDEY